MTQNTHMLLQLVATFLHPVVLSFPIETIIETINPAWRPFTKTVLSTGLGVLQMFLANKAQKYNPDGTPAEVAYVPEKKKDKN